MAQYAVFNSNPREDISELHEMVRNMSKFAFIHHNTKEDFFDTVRPLLRKYGVYKMEQPRRDLIHSRVLQSAVWALINGFDIAETTTNRLEELVDRTNEDIEFE